MVFASHFEDDDGDKPYVELGGMLVFLRNLYIDHTDLFSVTDDFWENTSLG